MKTTTALAAAAAAVFVVHAGALAQAAPKLHVNPRWEECSFQLDASLTQAAWHQFTQEAGLADDKPYGIGAAVGDVDNDGWPDLYVTKYGADRLFLTSS